MTDKDSASEMMDPDGSVAEQTKEHLRSTCAALDMTSLHHEIFLCQEQLDEITKGRQPLVIKKRGNYAYISREFTT